MICRYTKSKVAISGENMARCTGRKLKRRAKLGQLMQMVTRASNALVIGWAFGLCMGSCRSSGPVTTTELQHQADVTRTQDTIERLTERVGQYDNAITDAITAIEDVRERASTLDGTIDKLTELFEPYDSAVARVVRSLREVQGSTPRSDEVVDNHRSDSSLQVDSDGVRIHNVREGD